MTALNFQINHLLDRKTCLSYNFFIKNFTVQTFFKTKFKNSDDENLYWTKKQPCSYQGETLNVPSAFYGLWSSNNMKKLNVTKKNDFFLFWDFFV